jgi:hypothetical protein
MFDETYEDGEREGFYAGYKDGKSGKDFSYTQCQLNLNGEYKKGWEIGYSNGFKVGRIIRKHIS